MRLRIPDRTPQPGSGPTSVTLGWINDVGGKHGAAASMDERRYLGPVMDVFLLVPAISLVLWLGHAGLAIAGSPAARYTRWVLFGGLPVVAAVSLFSAGIFGFVLGIVAVLTWLGMMLLEVVMTMASVAVRDARAKKAV